LYLSKEDLVELYFEQQLRERPWLRWEYL
jgi:hypothetical protein